MIRNLFTFALLLGASMLLPCCAGTEHIVTQTQIVDRPVPTACVPTDTPGPPDYPDSDAALRSAPDAAARELLLYAGRKVRARRATLLEGILAGCR